MPTNTITNMPDPEALEEISVDLETLAPASERWAKDMARCERLANHVLVELQNDLKLARRLKDDELKEKDRFYQHIYGQRQSLSATLVDVGNFLIKLHVTNQGLQQTIPAADQPQGLSEEDVEIMRRFINSESGKQVSVSNLNAFD